MTKSIIKDFTLITSQTQIIREDDSIFCGSIMEEVDDIFGGD